MLGELASEQASPDTGCVWESDQVRMEMRPGAERGVVYIRVWKDPSGNSVKEELVGSEKEGGSMLRKVFNKPVRANKPREYRFQMHFGGRITELVSD